MKKILFVAVLATVAITACKKKDTSTPTPTPTPTPVDTNKATSRYDALTAGKWRVSDAVLITVAKDTFLDYYNGQMTDCEKDNFFFFNKSGTVTSDEGATKCDPSVAQTTTDGSWLLNSDTTQFTIKDSKIISLLSGELKSRIILIDKNNFKLAKDTSTTTPIPFNGTLYLSFKRVY